MLAKQVKMTSFIKVKVTTSPLAMDDSYLAEEFLTFDLSGIDDYLQIRIADLLANDRGGAAKTFHSVDATTSDGVPIIYDQTAQALLFDATAYQGLAEGETAEVTFKYMIQLADGKLSEALVTFQVIGENDGPDASDMTLAATEHQPLANVLFDADDIDSDDGQSSLTYRIADGPARGTVTLDGNRFSFDPGTAFDGLAKDETGTATFTYMATDRHGAESEVKTVTIAVTGENDAPVAQASSASGYEDMPITASFAADDVDSDDGQASLTYEIVDQPDSGAVTVNADGTFTFDPNGDFDHLSAGQEAQVTFTYRAVDRHGAASSAETVTLTIQGKGNTPAMISGDLFSPDLLIEDSGNYFTFGQLIVTDPDPGEAGFQDVDPADLVGQYGTFTFDNGAWTYTLDNEAAQSLPTGEGPEDHLVVTSIDGTASAVIRARIKGENDPATFTGTDSVSFMENETEARGGTLA